MNLKVGRFYKRRDGALVFVWRTGYATPVRDHFYTANYVLLCGKNHPNFDWDEWFCMENGQHYPKDSVSEESGISVDGNKTTHDVINEVKNPQYYYAEDHNIREINEWLEMVQDENQYDEPINVVEIAAVCGALRKVGLDMFIEKCEEGKEDDDERIRVIRGVSQHA